MVIVHEPVGSPYAFLINSILGNFEELKFIHIDVCNVALVRRQPCRDKSLVAMEPMRPVEETLLPASYGGDVERARIISLISRNIKAIRVHDRANLSAAERDSLWNRVHGRVNTHIPSRVACKEGSVSEHV